MSLNHNSLLLSKVLIILRDKKAGKKVIKEFTDFIAKYESLKKEFYLTFPENSGKIEE